MTYSYARQAWVEKKIDEGIFGITLISRAAGIPESTGKTWLRQHSNRLPSHKKMPREYERALGLLLLEKYPDQINQISKIIFTTPRMLKEWDIENRLHWEKSDLRRQTKYMIDFLRPKIGDYFHIDPHGKMKETKGQLPDSSEFELKFFEMLNLVLYLIIEMESDYRASRIAGEWGWLAHLMSPEAFIEAEMESLVWRKEAVHVPMYGPHKYRYVTHNDYEPIPFCWGDAQTYKPGSLSGVNIGGEYEPSRSFSQKMEVFILKYGRVMYESELLPQVIELSEYLRKKAENRKNASEIRREAS